VPVEPESNADLVDRLSVTRSPVDGTKTMEVHDGKRKRNRTEGEMDLAGGSRARRPCRLRGGAADATPATVPAYTPKTLASATFGEIESHAVSNVSDPHWRETIKTRGLSDLYVQQNDWDPALCGGCIPSTGWHTHPGPSLVIVTQGSVTAYDGDDPECTPHVYTANSPNNSFIDLGDGVVHIIRDESGAPAQTIAVQLVPSKAQRRQDVSAPGNCPF
jgi:hypothetical protein